MSVSAPDPLTTVLVYVMLVVNVLFIIGALIWLEWDSHRPPSRAERPTNRRQEDS